MANKVMSTAIKKVAMFTDIHWGKFNNSVVHNQDCLNFIDFFCEQVKADKDITHIVFLGDWFENRNAVNIKTLEMSYHGAKKVNDLGLPIYHIVGNHDLYHRHTRDTHSVIVFNELKNYHIVNDPIWLDEKYLLMPYLFTHEYIEFASDINSAKYVFGHFEFKDFVVTGATHKLDHGPDGKLFGKPTFIFSGHFHKRQVQGNIIYIGNTFPSNYGDAGDADRGMAIVDTRNDDVEFINWEGSPLYYKITLSSLSSEKPWEPRRGSKVRCLKDVDIGYQDAQNIKQAMIETYALREFVIEENTLEKKEALIGDNEDDPEIASLELSNIDQMVEKLLLKVTGTTTISNDELVKIYKLL